VQEWVDLAREEWVIPVQVVARMEGASVLNVELQFFIKPEFPATIRFVRSVEQKWLEND